MTDLVETLKQDALNEVEILRKIGVDCQVTETNQWRCAVEIERLRKAINDYLTGDYERPVGKRWRKDAEPCKHDKCVHKKFMWEECEPCIDMHFMSVLKLDNKTQQSQYEKTKTPANREKS